LAGHASECLFSLEPGVVYCAGDSPFRQIKRWYIT